MTRIPFPFRILIASLAVPSSSVAFVPAVETSGLEIARPGAADVDRHERFARANASRILGIESEIARARGGTWRVIGWNGQTDGPHYVVGSGFETHRTLSDDLAAELAARAVLGAHPEVFGRVAGTDLQLDDVRRGRGKVAVHFRQLHGGVPVYEGRAHVTMTDEGRAFAMRAGLYGRIDVDPTPALGADRAEAIARDAVSFDEATDRIEGTPHLLVLPVPASPSEVEFRLVWRVRVRTSDPLGAWVTHVDAHTGEIVWRFNDLHFLEYFGTATEDVRPDTHCNGAVIGPARYMRLARNGGPPVFTSGKGAWNAGDDGTSTATITAGLRGLYATVGHFGGPTVTAAFSGTATAGSPFTIAWTDANSRRDERDVFGAINDLHDFFEFVDPGWAYSNGTVPAVVSWPNTCNAFFDPNNGSINFFVAGNGCTNSGEIQGVVHHEYGHGVQNHLLGGTQGEQGLGEGNSDVLANLMTGESVVGRGFFFGDCTSGIRDSDNALRFPDHVAGQGIHSAGRVIAGFHWDVTVALQSELGPSGGTFESAALWHFGRKLERPTTQPDQVLATFIADDDDGDLTNGTPNCEILNQAALGHGFDPVDCVILIEHARVDTRTTEGDVAIIAHVTSSKGVVGPAGVTLGYSVNAGPDVIVSMADDDLDQVFEATIPGLVQPSDVAYWIAAGDDAGNDATDPVQAPFPNRHLFDVAAEWWDMEGPGDAGWTVNADGTDDATTGIWVRVDPIGTLAQPEDDHTSLGTMLWVTGQHDPDSTLGFSDVDGGRTRLYSPVVDLTNRRVARLKFWDWFSNNMGAAPGSDLWKLDARTNGGSWREIFATLTSGNRWVQRDLDLKIAFGDTIGMTQFRFVAMDTGDPSLVELAIDDVALLTETDAVGVEENLLPETPPFATYLRGARPNPFNPRTTIGFGLATDGHVRLDVYDVVGRLVRSLVDAPLYAGHFQVVWAGDDVAGRAAGSGVYYARLRAPGIVESRKLTLLR